MAYSRGSPTVSATRARQGRTGRRVLWVLVFGIALTVLGFAATWAWKAGDLNVAQSVTSPKRTDVAGYKAPPPGAASRQNERQTPATSSP